MLFSGGLDSTISLYLARERFERVYALTINYGQANVYEIYSARNIFALASMGTKCEIEHVAINIPFLPQLAHSGLTDGSYDLDVGQQHRRAMGFSNAFVPGRNMFFLSAAAALAYQKKVATIYIGTTMRGYPDCRTPFLDSMQHAINWGLGTDLEEPEVPIRIVSPYAEMHDLYQSYTVRTPRREKWMELAVELPGCWEAIAFTHSCYKGQTPACGECLTCRKRYWGFKQVALDDPIEYAKIPERFEWGLDD